MFLILGYGFLSVRVMLFLLGAAVFGGIVYYTLGREYAQSAADDQVPYAIAVIGQSEIVEVESFRAVVAEPRCENLYYSGFGGVVTDLGDPGDGRSGWGGPEAVGTEPMALAMVGQEPVVVLASPASVPLVRSLGKGAKGTDVSALQAALVSAGYLDAESADGRYGSTTAKALAALQADVGLKATGVFEPGVFHLVPVGAVIEEPLVEIGQSIAPSSPIFCISNGTPRVTVSLRPDELGLIGESQAFTSSERPIVGQIGSVPLRPKVNDDGSALYVIDLVVDPAQLEEVRIGDSFAVSVEQERRMAITVPASAVSFRGSEASITLADGTRRPVEAVRIDGATVELAEPDLIGQEVLTPNPALFDQ